MFPGSSMILHRSHIRLFVELAGEQAVEDLRNG